MRSLMFCDFLNPDAVRQPVTFMGDTLISLKFQSSYSICDLFIHFVFSADWRRSLVSRSGVN